MTIPAIIVQGVSKKYRLFASPTERLKERFHPSGKIYHSEFWALRNVSFDVPKGQTVGILGRNGSGKSTLLELITGILQPTRGTISVKGRLSALLQLGAGFNPEFTGRENVILNCVLLGITEKEAARRLPKIEAFAGIGQFIDQPVKTYSSGMFARLAFSTAIHVDPDILIIDEILAVGDARFQEQCFHKLQEFTDRGNTTLFVSHDINAIVKHCDHAILLDEGQLVTQGQPDDVADRYIELLYRDGSPQTADVVAQPPARNTDQTTETSGVIHEFVTAEAPYDALQRRRAYNPHERTIGPRKAEVVDCLLLSELDGEDPPYITPGARVTVLVKVRLLDLSDPPLQFGFAIRTVDGIPIYGTNTVMWKSNFRKIDGANFVIFKFTFDAIMRGGDYFMDIGVYHARGLDADYLSVRRRAIHFNVRATPSYDGLVNLAPSERALEDEALAKGSAASLPSESTRMAMAQSPERRDHKGMRA